MSGNTSASGGYLTPISPAPPDDDVLNKILHDLVMGITGLDGARVFPRWQPQPPTFPQPPITWAAVGVTGKHYTTPWGEQVHNPGPDAPTGITSTSTQVRQQDLEVVASFYGGAAGGTADVFGSGLLIGQNLEQLGTFGLKLRACGDPTHVPELINTNWVNRWDITFRLTRQVSRVYTILDLVSSESDIVSDTGFEEDANSP